MSNPSACFQRPLTIQVLPGWEETGLGLVFRQPGVFLRLLGSRWTHSLLCSSDFDQKVQAMRRGAQEGSNLQENPLAHPLAKQAGALPHRPGGSWAKEEAWRRLQPPQKVAGGMNNCLPTRVKHPLSNRWA